MDRSYQRNKIKLTQVSDLNFMYDSDKATREII